MRACEAVNDRQAGSCFRGLSGLTCERSSHARLDGTAIKVVRNPEAHYVKTFTSCQARSVRSPLPGPAPGSPPLPERPSPLVCDPGMAHDAHTLEEDSPQAAIRPGVAAAHSEFAVAHDDANAGAVVARRCSFSCGRLPGLRATQHEPGRCRAPPGPEPSTPRGQLGRRAVGVLAMAGAARAQQVQVVDPRVRTGSAARPNAPEWPMPADRQAATPLRCPRTRSSPSRHPR